MPSQSSSMLLQVSVVGMPSIALHCVPEPSPVQTTVPARAQGPMPARQESPRPLPVVGPATVKAAVQ